MDDAMIDTRLFERCLANARRALAEGDHGLAIEQFRAALAFWRGVPFAWMDTTYFNTERDRLEQLHAAAIEDLTAVEIAAGDHASAVATLKTTLAAQPLQENLWELLLQGLSGLGRRAEALAAYQDARQVLRTELGLEPSARLRELHHRLLVSVPAEQEPPSRRADIRDIGVPANDRPAPAPDEFVGRAAELSEITSRLLGTHQPALVGLTGAANIGKTALAVHAAHVLRPYFPDGPLYVSLSRPDGAPVAPEVALAELLRRCALPETRIPRSLSDLVAVWQATTAGRRAVIVLDDVQDRAQVLPLLPAAAGPAVLVTSARRLTGLPALHTITVGGLTRADALQLLGSIIGHHRLYQDVEVAPRLVAACGYQPHLVRTAAMTFLGDPRRTLHDIERELSAPDVCQNPLTGGL
jgi:hypothetical protein